MFVPRVGKCTASFKPPSRDVDALKLNDRRINFQDAQQAAQTKPGRVEQIESSGCFSPSDDRYLDN